MRGRELGYGKQLQCLEWITVCVLVRKGEAILLGALLNVTLLKYFNVVLQRRFSSVRRALEQTFHQKQPYDERELNAI